MRSCLFVVAAAAALFAMASCQKATAAERTPLLDIATGGGRASGAGGGGVLPHR